MFLFTIGDSARTDFKLLIYKLIKHNLVTAHNIVFNKFVTLLII